jgi:hypothetical protein
MLAITVPVPTLLMAGVPVVVLERLAAESVML